MDGISIRAPVLLFLSFTRLQPIIRRRNQARGMGDEELEKHLKHMLEQHTSTDLDKLAILLWNSNIYDKLRLGGLLRNISVEVIRDRNLKK